MKSVLNMTLEERIIYIRQKAERKVYNKLNNKYKLIMEERKHERI